MDKVDTKKAASKEDKKDCKSTKHLKHLQKYQRKQGKNVGKGSLDTRIK